MVAKVKHPCIGICTTTLGDEVCRGCHRTMAEIRDWLKYTDEEKRKVMEAIAERKGVS